MSFFTRNDGAEIIKKKLSFSGTERWLLVTLIKCLRARMGDCGRSGVDSVSAALVGACQPTEKIRDTNIHRKHSPRYTDVPVFEKMKQSRIQREDRGLQRERQKIEEERDQQDRS